MDNENWKKNLWIGKHGIEAEKKNNLEQSSKCQRYGEWLGRDSPKSDDWPKRNEGQT